MWRARCPSLSPRASAARLLAAAVTRELGSDVRNTCRLQGRPQVARGGPSPVQQPLAVGLAKWSVWGAFWFRHARQEDRICETLHAPKRAKSEQPAHCPFQVLAEREDEKCQNSIIH